MRLLNMIIFFTVFFLLYGLINYYIFRHGWVVIPEQSALRKWYLVAFLFVSLSFIIGRTLENVWLSYVSDILIWIGSFWFAFMLYFFLAVVFLDLIRLVNHFIHFYPSFVTRNYEKTKQIIALGVLIASSFAILIGYINAQNVRIKNLTVSVNKKISGQQAIKLVMASDIHLGSIIGRKRFCKIVNLINNQNPDIVLFPGDMVDEDIAPVIKDNLGEALESIKAKWGVFASTGNHEYIGGVEKACSYLERHGVRMLRDQTIKINDLLYIIGREDRSIQSFTGRNRVPLAALVEDIDHKLPVILMDHQPIRLNEAQENGVDLQISGHTHNGQIWPLNYITTMVYELSWGHVKKGETHYYISSGAGTWGPPVRLGNSPEIVVIDFRIH